MVIPRAIIRDLHTGHEAARLMATTMLVFSVSPILGPLAGSTLTVLQLARDLLGGQRPSALAGLAVVVFLLPETYKPGEDRRAWAGLRHLRTPPEGSALLGLAFIGGFSQASFLPISPAPR